MARVCLRGIDKFFGAAHVIKSVDITIEDGEFVVFVGPSGCGKSTLLRMIAGLENIDAGCLEIGDTVVNRMQPRARGVAMVFQSYAIFPHMTVRENVAFGLTIAGVPKAEKAAKIAEAARILQMEHLLDRRPAQLSGGQRQRVAIGRAIVREPRVFLFDEPLSNLDAALRMDMRMEIARLHRQLGTTMIYVTHDQVEAMTLADKIVVLKGGQVMQAGAPMELFHNPDNMFVAGFLGAPPMNFLDVSASAISGDMARISSPVVAPLEVAHKGRPIAPGDSVILGIRPQHMRMALPGTGSVQGRVNLIERLGSETLVDFRLNDGIKMIATLGEDRIFEPGQMIDLTFDEAHVHLFPASDRMA